MAAPPFAATHALFRREVERKVSNLMADLARSGSSSDRPGNGGLELAAFQRLEDLDGIGADCPGNPQELDDVDAALAALVFRDEGLRLFQAFCQLMLGQLGVSARLD